MCYTNDTFINNHEQIEEKNEQLIKYWFKGKVMRMFIFKIRRIDYKSFFFFVVCIQPKWGTVKLLITKTGKGSSLTKKDFFSLFLDHH